MARPTAADHDDKAAAVLAAAGRVFAERGYEGATMADVAREAGFSKAGVYHYFASKEHILHELLCRSLEQVLADLCHADPGSEATDRLSVLFETYLRSFSTRLRVITPLLLRLDLLRGPWREEVKTLERRIVDRMAEAISPVNPALPPRTLAFLALGAANWTYYWYDPNGDVSVEDLARGASSLFTGALTHSPSSSR